MSQMPNLKTNGHIAPDDLSPFDDPIIAADMSNLDLAVLRQEAIRAGIDISATKYQTAIAGRRARARDLAAATAPNKPPQWFYMVRNFIQSFGNAILLGVMLILSYVALPVAILGLAYAEIQRVSLGVGLFDAPRAGLMAVVTVSTYLILLVVQAGMSAQRPGTARPVWSFRLFLGQVGYILGISRRWEPRQRTQDQLLGLAISRLGWLIILLGTAGSLKDELSNASGAWHTAISHIILDSDLITFLSLLGGVSLTAGLLAGLHFSVGLAFNQWQKLIPESGADFLAGSADYSAEQDEAERQFLLSLLQKSQKLP